ncbi:purine phosphoribosyltransferase family protein [bacterium]|nr:purine phosphoribosyltransferase family protein [bacterium]
MSTPSVDLEAFIRAVPDFPKPGILFRDITPLLGNTEALAAADTLTYQYDLEYGSDTLEMHRDGVAKGARVLVVDDVLATGGTAAACGRLLESAGASVVGTSFLVEIKPLGGRERLTPHRVESVLVY